jgi:catechol 2,3-dioxygenase-like lactoylglutathione lyase family enzyme
MSGESVHIFVAQSQFIEIFAGGTEERFVDNATVGPAHFCFEVDDAAKAIEEIRARGAPIDTELKKRYSGYIQFWTHDPDGSSIKLMYLPPNCLQVRANLERG